MKNRKLLYVLALVAGVILFILGMALLRIEVPVRLSAISIGIGAGLFGMSAGHFISMYLVDKYPGYKRKIDIEAKDERNVQINNLAKAKAFDVMAIIYSMLIIIFVYLDQNLDVIFLFIGAYLSGWVIYFVFTARYSKEL